MGLNFGPDLLDSVMISKSEMAKLSRMEFSFISALVKIVSLPGTVSSDSNELLQSRPIQMRAAFLYLANCWMKFKMLFTAAQRLVLGYLKIRK